MILQRPLIDYKSECSLDIPFFMCDYHREVVSTPYITYRITLDEARTRAHWMAYTCSDCEDPVW